jgi:hypothetical protein
VLTSARNWGHSTFSDVGVDVRRGTVQGARDERIFSAGLIEKTECPHFPVPISPRAHFLCIYRLAKGFYEKLQKQRFELSLKDCQSVRHALRQLFLAHLRCGWQFVAMPSQVADALWHELILYGGRGRDLFIVLP